MIVWMYFVFVQVSLYVFSLRALSHCWRALCHRKWDLYYRRRGLHHLKRALCLCTERPMGWFSPICLQKSPTSLQKSSAPFQKSPTSQQKSPTSLQKNPVPLPWYAHWQSVVTWRAALRRRLRVSRPRLILLQPSGIRPGAGGRHFWESTHIYPYLHLPHSSTCLCVLIYM